MLREGGNLRAGLSAKTQMEYNPVVEARGKERRGKKDVEKRRKFWLQSNDRRWEFLQLELDTLVSSFIEQTYGVAPVTYE